MVPLADAIRYFQRPHVLWVGAGLTTQLVGRPLGWAELVKGLEAAAGLSSPQNSSYPQRLDSALERVGEHEFQRVVRTTLFDPAIDALLANARSTPGGVPERVADVMRLGRFASAIANFNIETWSSTAVLAPGSAVSILPFVFQRREVRGTRSDITGATEHARIAFHPHGALNLGGLCVLTERDYRDLEATLAFRLAVHLAFRNRLLIVGMSLQDKYLRDQIAGFRPHIDQVVWFAPHADASAVSDWIRDTNIAHIEVAQDWGDFWHEVRSTLKPIAERAALTTYVSILQDVLSQRHHSALLRDALKELPSWFAADEAVRSKLKGHGAGSNGDWAAETRQVLGPLIRRLKEL